MTTRVDFVTRPSFSFPFYHGWNTWQTHGSVDSNLASTRVYSKKEGKSEEKLIDGNCWLNCIIRINIRKSTRYSKDDETLLAKSISNRYLRIIKTSTTFLDVFSIHYVTINIHLTFTFEMLLRNEWKWTETSYRKFIWGTRNWEIVNDALRRGFTSNRPGLLRYREACLREGSNGREARGGSGSGPINFQCSNHWGPLVGAGKPKNRRSLGPDYHRIRFSMRRENPPQPLKNSTTA